MTNTLLSTRCRCGTSKLPIAAGSSVGMCPNCDAVQPSERAEKPGDRRRIATPSDHRYALAWKKLERELYPDQDHD